MSRDETSRAIRCSKPVKTALVELRLIEQTTAAPTLDSSVAEGVERALDWKLPDDLLAVLAAGCDTLRERGVAAERIIGHTERARGLGCPRDLVVLGHLDGTYFCVGRGKELAVQEFDGESAEVGAPRPLAEWLGALVDERRADLVTPDDDEPDDRELAELEVGAGDLDSFKPRLIAPPPSSGKQVRHATFGVGEIIREIGAGDGRKLEVRFPIGTKVLIARVLEEL